MHPKRVITTMTTKRLILPWLMLIGMLPAMAQNLDYRILCSLQQHRTPAMDQTMRWVSNSLVLAPAVPAAMALGGWMADNQPTLHNSGQMGASLLTTGGITIGLKYAVGRPRPYQNYPDDLVSVTQEPDPSFPSGHTSLAFSTAVSLSLQYPQWYVVAPSLMWATAVGFSRLYLGVHYPSDVLTGMLIGTLSAYATYRIQQQRNSQAQIPDPKVMLPAIKIAF